MGSRQPRERATIQDVADQAGVSTATVSRVLNGSATVHDILATRVRAAMRDLRYQPSRAARTLAGRLSTIIGLVVIDMRNPFFLELIRGTEDVAQRNGYLIVLCNSDEDTRKERQYIDVLCAEPVAGAIIVPTGDREPVLAPFTESNIPVVTIDRRTSDGAADSVLIDNVGAAREAVTHLIANGYRRIGLITGPECTTTARERREGYRLALQDAGIAVIAEWERSGPYTEDSALHLAGELLALDPPPEALFTANNRLTTGTLHAAYLRGLRIPDQLAVVGFDEVPGSYPGAFSVTTVMQPAYELGATAATRLIQHLQNPDGALPREFVLAHQLRVGDSSRSRVSVGAPIAG